MRPGERADVCFACCSARALTAASGCSYFCELFCDDQTLLNRVRLRQRREAMCCALVGI